MTTVYVIKLKLKLLWVESRKRFQLLNSHVVSLKAVSNSLTRAFLPTDDKFLSAARGGQQRASSETQHSS